MATMASDPLQEEGPVLLVAAQSSSCDSDLMAQVGSAALAPHLAENTGKMMDADEADNACNARHGTADATRSFASRQGALEDDDEREEWDERRTTTILVMEADRDNIGSSSSNHELTQLNESSCCDCSHCRLAQHCLPTREASLLLQQQQHSPRRITRPRRRRCNAPLRPGTMLLLAMALGMVLSCSPFFTIYAAEAADAATTGNSNSNSLRDDSLTEDSVVLITGAAGFIGSELAMALHRTYHVKKLLCIDSMVSSVGSAATFQTEAEYKADAAQNALKARSEEDLALFEFKRQRAFHLLQTVGDRAHFYRSDFRPTMPEYFDTGEVPLLDTLFRTHPDITHVVHLADPYHAAMTDINEDGVGLTQAVPRSKDSTKSGMIEAILEQLKKVGDERGVDKMPHLLYASSFEVYNHAYPYPKDGGSSNGGGKDGADGGDSDNKRSSSNVNPNPPPFREDRNITVPSTLRGTAKVIDEILATTYNRIHGIYSVGLRLFPVYGPWGLPGTPLFEMAERAVSDPSASILSEEGWPRSKEAAAAASDGDGKDDDGDDSKAVAAAPPGSRGQQLPDDVRDYVYIDDAVDAIMTAMQYRPSVRSEENGAVPNLVINVGSGEGSTMRDVSKIMETHFPRSDENANINNEIVSSSKKVDPTVSFASTDRAKALLGFETQVSLEEGIANLLAWHFDRAYPYGGKPPTPGSEKAAATESEAKDDDDEGGEDDISGGHTIADFSISSCSPFDKECLHGAPVFPCASECSHESQCIQSYLDDATHISRSVTEGCDAVLYTVHFGDDVATIPSAYTAISPDSVPYFKENDQRCNVAFVSEGSELVRKLKAEKGILSRTSLSEEFLDKLNTGDGRGAASVLLTHGFWTLVPVASPPHTSKPAAAVPPEANDGYDDWHLLRLLPKISPGLFFSGKTKHAIYAEPDITFSNVPELLREAKMQPYKEGMQGATAALIGDGPAEAERRKARGDKAKVLTSNQSPNSPQAHSEALQLRAYNMIRVGLQGEMHGGGAIPIVDSSWIVHALGVEDARLFRCDVMGEIVQWEAASDERSLEFVMGLHDLWSRVIVTWGGVEPWWTDDRELLKVVPEGTTSSQKPPPENKDRSKQRRLSDMPQLMTSNVPKERSTQEREQHSPADSERRRLDDRQDSENENENDDDGEGDTDTDDDGDNDGDDKRTVDEGTWMGVLSSTDVHYFVRMLPSSRISEYVDVYSTK